MTSSHDQDYLDFLTTSGSKKPYERTWSAPLSEEQWEALENMNLPFSIPSIEERAEMMEAENDEEISAQPYGMTSSHNQDYLDFKDPFEQTCSAPLSEEQSEALENMKLPFFNLREERSKMMERENASRSSCTGPVSDGFEAFLTFRPPMSEQLQELLQNLDLPFTRRAPLSEEQWEALQNMELPFSILREERSKMMAAENASRSSCTGPVSDGFEAFLNGAQPYEMSSSHNQAYLDFLATSVFKNPFETTWRAPLSEEQWKALENMKLPFSIPSIEERYEMMEAENDEERSAQHYEMAFSHNQAYLEFKDPFEQTCSAPLSEEQSEALENMKLPFSIPSIEEQPEMMEAENALRSSSTSTRNSCTGKVSERKEELASIRNSLTKVLGNLNGVKSMLNGLLRTA